MLFCNSLSHIETFFDSKYRAFCLSFIALCIIKQCVAGNLGVSFLPRFAVEDELKRGTLVELPFSETPLTIHALCAHHAGKAISPAMRVFMQCMQEEQEAR